MDHHNQIHNDIKPQNYLVTFLNGKNDLSRIEIVLTYFGLAGSELKGGTPIFASPECLANPDRKDKSSDIFSLGRVFLFMTLPKQIFLEFLFLPLLTKRGKEETMELIEREPILNLISRMMRIENRIDLETIRRELDLVTQIQPSETVFEISRKIAKSTSKNTKDYIDILKHFS